MDAVHKNESFIFCQIAALGRSAHKDYLKTLGEASGVPEGFPYVSASNIKLSIREDRHAWTPKAGAAALSQK